MLNDEKTSQLTTAPAELPDYDRPRVTVIGDASRIILGVGGSGNDFFGYSGPEFEFEPDGNEATSSE